MNTRLLTLVLLLFVFAACNDVDEKTERIKAYHNDFPSYEEVLDFCAKHVKGTPEKGNFAFEKTPEGYFIKILSNEGDHEILQREKVWDFKTKKFVEFNLSKHLKQTGQGVDPFQNSITQQRYFDFYLFYGYGDAHMDVIKMLRGVENLSLRDCEQLARAYDRKAVNFIRPGIWGEQSSDTKGFKNDGYNKLSPKRIKDFMNSANESLKFYKKIIEKDPSYKTFIIDDVRLKYANNCVHYYNTLLSVKEEEKGQKYLDKAKYPAEYLAAAREYLDACDTNAVLFTDGDNDTFPLWYVQQMENHRKDVVVVNNSLMQTTWYCQVLKERFGIHMRTDLSKIQKAEMFFVRLSQLYDSKEKGEINQLIQDINALALASMDPYERLVSVPMEMETTINGNPTQFNMRTSHLLFNQWVLLDIIENNPDRNAFFVSTNALSGTGLEGNLALRGMVFELVPETVESAMDDETKAMFEKELAQFNPRLYKELPSLYSRKLYYLAAYIINDVYTEDPERYKELVKKIDVVLPDNAFYSQEGVYALQSKVYLKSKMDADYIRRAYVEFDAFVQKYVKNTKFTPDDLDNEIGFFNAVLRAYYTFTMSNLDDTNRMRQAYRSLRQDIETIQKSKPFTNRKRSQERLSAVKTNIDNYLKRLAYQNF